MWPPYANEIMETYYIHGFIRHWQGSQVDTLVIITREILR